MPPCFLSKFVYLNLMFCHTKNQELINLIQLKDERPIGRFLLVLAEGPSSPIVKLVTDGVPREGPLGRLGKIVTNGVLTMLL